MAAAAPTDEKVLAERVLATLVRLRTLPEGTVLAEIAKLVHEVKPYDLRVWFAIARVGLHLSKTARDKLDLELVWDTAISRTEAWLKRAEP